MDPEKRKLREEKRAVKRAGQKRRRHQLKRDLRNNPDDAHLSSEEFGRYRSAELNGLDQDQKRRSHDDNEGDEVNG